MKKNLDCKLQTTKLKPIRENQNEQVFKFQKLKTLIQGCNKLIHKKGKMVARDQRRDCGGVWVKRLYQSLIVMNEPSVTKKLSIYWLSFSHLWAWAVSSDRKNKITYTSRRNYMSFPPKGIWAFPYRVKSSLGLIVEPLLLHKEWFVLVQGVSLLGDGFGQYPSGRRPWDGPRI